MKEIIGNMFDSSINSNFDAICITTNGCVKASGECVMGRGNALEAKMRFPGIDKELGNRIKKNGNITQIITIHNGKHIVAFPTKHHWRQSSDIQLIETSFLQLLNLADIYFWKNILLPRPGCSNGKLTWEHVQPIIEKHIDDRFTIISLR